MPKFLYQIIIISLVLMIISTRASMSSKIKYATSENIIAKTISSPIPDSIKFAGEEVPLEFFDVKESLDREIQVNTYFHSQTILYLKRANRFFPEIERILKEENIPDDFKYLPVAESGLTNSVSPSKAAGFWQFLPKTAEEYGLEINDEIDERFNIERSTRAACVYLKETYQEFGSWTMAAAAYNVGKNALRKIIDNQKQNTYYNLFLNEETSRYVFRIIAIKLVMTNPENYGFSISQSDLYPSYCYNEIKIDTTINDLVQFAISQGINYKLLVMFNPWIKSKSLTLKKERNFFQLKIPCKDYRQNA